uniref:mRNA cap guanine-N7 methyltransferase 1 n=1 Tax=Tanacetum cinerariifolium TaxID=118510 RepID=A0A6L2KVY9_TANCI|nr:mRNA cap guanine-N7 methyltransferase 1 [Tanacetum cinerariifolium]
MKRRYRQTSSSASLSPPKSKSRRNPDGDAFLEDGSRNNVSKKIADHYSARANRTLEEREANEPRLLDTTVGRTVPLLPVAPDRADSELKASVERLFDKGGSGTQTEQRDSTKGGQYANIRPVVEATNTVVEDAALVQSRRRRKRKSMVVGAGGVSHPPKKMRGDHGTSSGASVDGKSRSALQRLLVGAVLNVEVRVTALPTLPFVTASVSTTSEREDGDHTDSIAEPNFRTIGDPQRSSVLIMTTVTTTTSTVDPTLPTKEKFVEPSSFGASSSSAGGTDPIMGVFSNLTSSDFLVGAILTVVNPDTDLQKLFASIREMKHDQLFTEFNVGAARQMSLSAEVRMRVEYNVKEKRREAEDVKAIRLRAEASNFESVEKSLRDETNALRERDVILENERNALDVKVTKLETSAMSKKVHELEISSFGLQENVTVYENCMKQLEKFQDDRMKIVEDKFDMLYIDFVEMALHLEEKFYPRLLTTISGRRWLLTHGMKLAVANFLNSPKYLSTLGSAIGKAIEKGMQDGLSAGITHGKEGRVLSNVVAYNPSAEVDYISILQQLQNVNFSLLARLKSIKDASVETVMDILRLEGPLAEKLGLNELQPNVDQLMVPIHHSPNQVVVGATTLSLALDVSSARIRKIRDDIANQRSALRDEFVPLVGPFSAAVLTGTEGTSNTATVTADTTMVLSTTFASASTIARISVDDYEVMGADDQTVADENVASFPSVDDAELNIPQ